LTNNAELNPLWETKKGKMKVFPFLFSLADDWLATNNRENYQNHS